ncbi:hypothetical protein D3C80_1012100 [compost metagenome]
MRLDGGGGDRVGVGHVQCDGGHGADFLGGGFQCIRVQIPEHDLAALGDDAGGRGLAQARGAAGDDGGAAGETSLPGAHAAASLGQATTD